MQIFNTYMKIMKKQWGGILIYMVMFVVITIVVSKLVFPNQNNIFEVKQVSMHVVNRDESSLLVKGLLEQLQEYGKFVEIEDTQEARQDALFYGQVSYILTIPENFTKNFIDGKEVELIRQSAPSSTAAISIDSTIDHYLNAASRYLRFQPGISEAKLYDELKESQGVVTKVSYQVDHKDKDVASRSFNQYYFNYLGYVITVCFIIAIGIVLIQFHNIDIRRRHFASPITIRSYNGQMLFANSVFAIIFLILFGIVGYVFNPFRSMNITLVLHWLNVIAYGAVVVSMSYLIGISVKQKRAIQALATTISLGMAFMSGMFVPQAFLGKPLLRVGIFLPGYWYVKVNNILTQNPYSTDTLQEILLPLIIQLAFAIAFISISMVVHKRKRQLAY